MVRITDKKNCCGCGACEQSCPKHCITLNADNEGFMYPAVDEKCCINCGLCEKVCPVIKPKEKEKCDTAAFAAYCKDKTIRRESSSGGIFSLVATVILNKGGVVYGAAFDESFNVVHQKIETIENLGELRGSKYVQSNKLEVFTEIKELLSKETFVLFSGTPCEVNALYKYLGHKDTTYLYTCDFVCHGVPSPKVWKKYLDEKEKEYDAKTEYVFHRDKRHGWKTYSITLLLSSMTKTAEYSKILTFDKYLQTFLRNVSLRPSCYNCKFKGVERVSDITLADFWGISRVLPAMNNDTGVSLVLVQSEKGKELFGLIKPEIEYKEVVPQQVVKINENITVSAKEPESRRLFFENIDNFAFNELYNSYVRRSNSYEAINLVKGYTKLLLHYLHL
uniref:F420H(2):quinone oxidoreductase n=1 Tax=uncultured Prevotella sp. TaxID=159272 RepID=A0A6G8F1B9_9BACT|nr:F420H(2):quinone oxidoreductase [uncultured Prevotella sp.]